MDFKTYFENLVAAKEKRATELKELIKNGETLEAVRAAGAELETVNAELTEARQQLAAASVPEVKPEERQQFNPMGAYGQNTEHRAEVGILDSTEYREAFAQYVRTGDVSQFEQFATRADATLIASEVGKIIPNTIMNEFIKELKVYGNLYNRVRKLNVRGGVEFPIEELAPTVKWITETTKSDTQKAPQINTSVSFGYHIAEARIAQSLLSQVVALPVLESEIARLLAEAFVKEFDNMIVNGSGSGQPTGILNDTRLKAANKITMTDAEVADWANWRKSVFAKVPLAYRGQGVLIMTAATWESQIMTLKDANDRPVYAETYDPQTGALSCRFAGREVILVESDILKDFDTAAKGEAFAIYMRPTDYAINSNLQIGFKRWFDDDNNKWINKGLCILDGKLLDTAGVFVLTKNVVSAG